MKRTFFLAAAFALLLFAFSVSAISVTTCQSLNIPGGYYQLQNDITYSGAFPCFTLDAVNVTLEGNGYTLTPLSTGPAVSLSTGFDGLTLRNIKVRNHPSNAIRNLGATNAVIDNVDVRNSSVALVISYNLAVAVPTTTVKNSYLEGGINIQRSKSTIFHDNDIINSNFIVNGQSPSNNITLYDNNLVNVSFTHTPQTTLNLSFVHNVMNDSDLFSGFVSYNVLFNDSTQGNFWVNGYGNGFSEVCTDIDDDGNCDGVYTVFSGGVDYLPVRLVTTAPAAANEPPVYTSVFAGTDEAVQNFVFYVTMSDKEGGQTFQSLLWNAFGTYNNLTNIDESLYFRTIDELTYVTNPFSAYVNFSIDIKSGVPGQWFGADGYVQVNNTLSIGPVDVTVAPIKVSDIDSNISVSGNVVFWGEDGEPGEPESVNTISLYSSTFQKEGTIEVDISHGSGTVYANISVLNYSSFNFTRLATNVQVPNGHVSWSADIDPIYDTVEWRIYDGYGVLLTQTIEPLSDFSDFSVVRFNDFSTSGLTLIGDVSVRATGTVNYPPYVYFDTLAASNTTTHSTRKAIKKPINGADYGEYETYLWGTDAVHGLSYYQIPHYATFTFNANTPKLSDEEIATAVNDYNSESSAIVVISGDIATDYLPRVYDIVGIKSTGSRFLLGLVLIICTVLLLYGFGSAVVIFVIAIEAVAFCFPSIGLFPSWFVIVEVIIAAGLVAYSLRHTTGGN